MLCLFSCPSKRLFPAMSTSRHFACGRHCQCGMEAAIWVGPRILHQEVGFLKVGVLLCWVVSDR